MGAEADLDQGWLERLFGKELLRCSAPEGLESTTTALGSAQELAVYFSFANISAEGDELSSALQKLYKSRNADGYRFEVVQVVLWARTDLPLDHAASFERSIQRLPWYAVPFDDVDTKRRLTHKYRIKVGAPKLVVLDSGGEELSRPTAELLQQPGGFPWQPRPVCQVLQGVPLERCGFWQSGDALDEKGTLTYADLPKSSIKAFYFAAHWCPPCKAFSPQLAETYTLLRRRGHDFHIIFVSSDRSEESYRRASMAMPWLSVGWEAGAARRELAMALAVEGIPALRILLPEAQPYEARAQAAGDPDGMNFPWKPGPVNILTEYHLSRLRDHPAIVLFVAGEIEELHFAKSVLLPAAESYYEEYRMRHPGAVPPYLASPEEESIDFEYSEDGAKATGRRRALLFLIGVNTEVSDALRDMAGLDDAEPLLTAIDFPHRRLAVMMLGEPITTLSVQNFLDNHLSGELPCTLLQPYQRELPIEEFEIEPQPISTDHKILSL